MSTHSYLDALPRLKRGAQRTGDGRAAFPQKVVTACIQDRASISEIAEKTGRSYGTIHRPLDEAEGVTIRPHGGSPLSERSVTA